MNDNKNKNENPNNICNITNTSSSATTNTSSSATTVVLSNAIGSALAGIVSRIFTHPLDTIKARLQVPQNVVVSSTTVAATVTASSIPLKYSYKGPLDVLYRTIHNEGIYGLYRGFNTVIIGGIPGTVCYLCTYEYMKESLILLRQQSTSDNSTNNNTNNDFIIHFSSGMIAETIACIIYVPVDVIKERLQVQNQHQHQHQPNTSSYYYKNGYDALIQISKTEGIRGVYRGYGATLASFGPFSALYFTLYEQMKVYSRRYIYNSNVLVQDQDDAQQQQEGQQQQQIVQSTTVPQHQRQQQSQSFNADDTTRNIGTPSDYDLEKLVQMPFLYTLLCSTSAGAIASWCTSPLDMVKLRLQVNRAAQQQASSNASAVVASTISSSTNFGKTKPPTTSININMISLLHNTIVTEGITGLFRGAGARVLHFTPATAITITLYETCRSWVYQILQPK